MNRLDCIKDSAATFHLAMRRSPWNSRLRVQWQNMAMEAHDEIARIEGRKFSIVAHKNRIIEAHRLGRDWYAVY